jgi:hypothetical protein
MQYGVHSCTCSAACTAVLSLECFAYLLRIIFTSEGEIALASMRSMLHKGLFGRQFHRHFMGYSGSALCPCCPVHVPVQCTTCLRLLSRHQEQDHVLYHIHVQNGLAAEPLRYTKAVIAYGSCTDMSIHDGSFSASVCHETFQRCCDTLLQAVIPSWYRRC